MGGVTSSCPHCRLKAMVKPQSLLLRARASQLEASEKQPERACGHLHKNKTSCQEAATEVGNPKEAATKKRKALSTNAVAGLGSNGAHLCCSRHRERPQPRGNGHEPRPGGLANAVRERAALTTKRADKCSERAQSRKRGVTTTSTCWSAFQSILKGNAGVDRHREVLDNASNSKP